MQLPLFPRRYVFVNFVSTKLSPFGWPYAWSWKADAETVASKVAEALNRWPDVTATVVQ